MANDNPSSIDPTINPAYLRRLMHDLKTPVRHVTLFSEFVEEALSEPVDLVDARQAIRTVHGAARAMHRMTHMVSLHMRTIQALAAGSTTLDPTQTDEPYQLAELVGKCWTAVEGKMESLSVRGDATPRPPRSVMQLVCEQVLSNAICFADESRPLAVVVSIDELRDDTVLTVTDNGIGIDMEFANQIRQPFERLGSSDQGHGAGLGLTLAIMWVESWGGNLKIESDGATGTTVTMRWPTR